MSSIYTDDKYLGVPMASWVVGMKEDTIEHFRLLINNMHSSFTFARLAQSERPLHILVHFGGWNACAGDIMHEIGKLKSLDINKRDKNGITALHLASYYGFEEHVEELLKLGADPNIQNEDGKNAISDCCRWQRHIPILRQKNYRILNMIRNPPPTYFALAQKNKLAMVMNKLSEENKLRLGTMEDIYSLLESIGFPPPFIKGANPNS